MTAGRMLMEGSSVSTVAEVLHLSSATVRRYKAVLEDGGLAVL
jgi:predicted transcriptional regulator